MFRDTPEDMVRTLQAQRDCAAIYCAADPIGARKSFIGNDRRFDIGLDAKTLIERLDWNRDGSTALAYIKEHKK
jgi:hypothetical protein